MTIEEFREKLRDITGVCQIEADEPHMVYPFRIWIEETSDHATEHAIYNLKGQFIIEAGDRKPAQYIDTVILTSSCIPTAEKHD